MANLTAVGADATSTASENGADKKATEKEGVKIPAVGPADIAIFWDYENVRIPAGCPASTATDGIRNKVAKYGRIVEKRLYYDSRQPTEHSAPRAELDLSGFTLVDCPSRNRKETLDKKLIVDMLCFAWERAFMGGKTCVVLITSDGDYSYAVARLRDIGVFTIIIYRPDNVAKVLIDNANIVMSWEFDVLGGPPSQIEDEISTVVTVESTTSATKSDSIEDSGLKEVVVKEPTQQIREKFALFCNAVLNSQYRNVKEGISVYSSWAAEAGAAATFYDKIGETDRNLYHNLRALGTQKGFVEWGRRNLSTSGRPIVRVKDRDDRADGLSPEVYLRLTYSGLSILKPNLAAQETDWKLVYPKTSALRSVIALTTHGSSIPALPTAVPALNGKSSWKSNTNLFVGGLAWQTTEDSLRSYFRQFGPLDKVVMMHGRGFGFVWRFEAHRTTCCGQQDH
jgi:hypothetical protein